LNVPKAFHDKKVSFGELVAHLLPINNVENIASHLGVLLEGNFSNLLENLKHFEEPDYSKYIEEDEEDEVEVNADKVEDTETEESPAFIEDINYLMSTLSKIFTIRHIIVHEADFGNACSEQDLIEFFTVADKFIDALEELINQTL
jgi:hypothetical protein